MNSVEAAEKMNTWILFTVPDELQSLLAFLFHDFSNGRVGNCSEIQNYTIVYKVEFKHIHFFSHFMKIILRICATRCLKCSDLRANRLLQIVQERIVLSLDEQTR